ncbi:DNA repair protein RecO [Parerythrobacter lacustris]|uniref:Recombination protein O N-terminal domain-containing protein n=1 Tax=Parerythrobacter lacustris TaxID=2969984 RepID=A0ABT1XP04_9SPHN|nr:recombination protein O N-terminal domain-containing protein [Parerythrobacter lacustris]MCR2833395.1 recombination protein O N-terminal domain-containing protein [Parerythrobacter lacustris]
MNLRSPAILVSARPHGETAVIARLLTEEHGLVAGYVAGGRGRNLRPVVIPGNLVEVELRSKSDSQLPFARLELVQSRGPWLGEPLPAIAIGWATALTATVLPERNAYPSLYVALGALLDAVCNAGSAREWLRGMIAYEALLLRELGYGGAVPAAEAELAPLLEIFALQGPLIERYLLADRKADVMAARGRLRERLGRMV